VRVGVVLVFHREGRSGVSVGEIFVVLEGGENKGDCGGDIGCVRGREKRGAFGEIFGVSEGWENRGEGGVYIWCIRGRGEEG